MNTAKFNHLYKVDVVSEITLPALQKIGDILDPVFKKELTIKQVSQFVSNGGNAYDVYDTYKISNTVPGLKDYAFNFQFGIRKDIGLEWMHATKGTFPKRFASYLYKNYGIKLDTEVLSKIGTVASAGNTDKSTLYFDIFDCANEPYWNSGKYGDHGSCLWGGKDGALSVFKDNSVMALRTYYDAQLLSAWKSSKIAYPTLEKWFAAQKPETKWNFGRGRAWMYYQPDMDCYIFWNGYDSKGQLQAIHYARTWATVSGMTYHKITYLNNNGSNSGTIYINSGSGWAVHAMDNIKASNLLDYDFRFNLDKSKSQPVFECEDCGWTSHDEDDFHTDHSNRLICQSCRDNHYHYCEATSMLYHEDELVYIEGKGVVHEGRRYAGDAWYNDTFITNHIIVFTEDTEKYIWAKNAYRDDDGFYWAHKPKKESTI